MDRQHAHSRERLSLTQHPQERLEAESRPRVFGLEDNLLIILILLMLCWFCAKCFMHIFEFSLAPLRLVLSHPHIPDDDVKV